MQWARKRRKEQFGLAWLSITASASVCAPQQEPQLEEHAAATSTGRWAGGACSCSLWRKLGCRIKQWKPAQSVGLVGAQDVGFWG